MNKLKAPKPVGPYSLFRYLNDDSDWVTCGQIPLDPESGELNNETIEKEVEQVLDNI